MLNLVLHAPWETGAAAPAEGEQPEWWPPRLFAGWHAWTGVTGLLYARWMRSSPPVVVRARTPKDLMAAVRHAIAAAGRRKAA